MFTRGYFNILQLKHEKTFPKCSTGKWSCVGFIPVGCSDPNIWSFGVFHQELCPPSFFGHGMNLRDLGLNMGYTGTPIAQNYDFSTFFFDLTPCWPIFCKFLSPQVSEFLHGPPSRFPWAPRLPWLKSPGSRFCLAKIPLSRCVDTWYANIYVSTHWYIYMFM